MANSRVIQLKIIIMTIIIVYSDLKIQCKHFKQINITSHSKIYWVVLTQLWVKYGQTQPLGYIF